MNHIPKDRVFYDENGNELFSIKLIDGRSYIYVDGMRFKACRFVPISIPVEELPKYDSIESIDDIIRHLDRSLEARPPKWIHGESLAELDFFVNCSNMQAWVENDFNTRILDSRLS
ncbi:MAG: hypothetical protein ACTSYF_01450, partial [Promethearchaeota archaeon]